MPTLLERARALLPDQLWNLGVDSHLTWHDRRGQPVPMMAASLFKQLEPGYERIGDTYTTGRLGLARVSTVWLDEPVFEDRDRGTFETMLFCDDPDWDTTRWRYRTKREAEIGHRKIVRLVRLMQKEPRVIVKPHKARHWR